MRQVIRRFLKHLEAEKNASPSTIDSYQYDLNKFDDYVAHRLGNRFLPGDISRDHIRGYLMWLSEVGHQKPNGPLARARALAAIRSFFKYAHRAGLLRDNPAADIALPKIRMAEIRALSQDECGRLLRVVETNRSPFKPQGWWLSLSSRPACRAIVQLKGKRTMTNSRSFCAGFIVACARSVMR